MHEDFRPLNADASTNSADYKAIAHIVMAARKVRYRLFPRSMFSESAWDILLLLYPDGHASLADLAKSAETPQSTAARWIDFLETHELATRERSGGGRGADQIRLTAKARNGLQAFFSILAGNWPIAAATE